MLKWILYKIFPTKIIRVPTGLYFVTYSLRGRKFVKIFDLKNGGSICFKVDSIDYKNSEFGDRLHPEAMFEEIELD